MILKNFIVLEGVDGSGTSTQLSLLAERAARGDSPVPLHQTFEPTDGPLGALIRSALAGTAPVLPQTLARLFAADRGEHLYASGGVLERCASGARVVCDRYVLSSLVYQGLECGDELPRSLNDGFPKPELLLFFDVDPAIAERRYAARAQRDVYERLDFQRKVRDRYLDLVEPYCAEGTRLFRIDASRPIEEVAERVWSALADLPIIKG